jgi:CTP-dependent riboflavin kinase
MRTGKAMTATERIAEAETLLLVGEACSGLGEGAGFTRLDWVRREFLAKLGFEPYPGTFNLRMGGAEWEAARRILAREPGIAIVPERGYCAAKCFHVVLAGCITGAVVFPDVAGYPPDKFEVISAVPVRQALGVADGDRLAVSILR